jgi:hypothetical protein
MEDTNWKIDLEAVPARDRSPATDAAIDNGSDIVLLLYIKMAGIQEGQQDNPNLRTVHRLDSRRG